MHRADFSFIRCHSVFRGLTRRSSATAGGGELCFHFILHNSSFSLSVRRPAVGSSDWLGLCGAIGFAWIIDVEVMSDKFEAGLIVIRRQVESTDHDLLP